MSTKPRLAIQVANTVTGEYDVRLPLPKPLWLDPASGRVVRRVPEFGHVAQVIGFVEDPARFEVDLTWASWILGPVDGDETVVGMFAVVLLHDGDMATLTTPITRVQEVSA